jgi:hypothetical protein
MPRKACLDRLGGLPNADFPSDHIPLVAEFEFCKVHLPAQSALEKADRCGNISAKEEINDFLRAALGLQKK